MDQLLRLDPDTIRIALDGQLFDGFDHAQALDRIQSPMLLLYGDPAQGAALGDDDAAFVHTHVASAVTVKIPDGSHMFFEKQAEMTMKHINAFLSSL